MQLFEALSMHVASWLDEWNKLRKQGNISSKIEVIELRSNPKYGGFFTHEPVKARVSFRTGVRRLDVEKTGASSRTPKSTR